MKEMMKENKFFGVCIKILGGYILFAVLLLVLLRYVLMLSTIPTKSMEGTILSGDMVLSTRLNLSEETIHRYNILIFPAPALMLYRKDAISSWVITETIPKMADTGMKSMYP